MKHLLVMLVAFMAFCALGMLLLVVSSDEGDIMKPLLYFGGGCTVIMMGFSPTLYASGDRTLFIFMVFAITVAFMTGSEALLCKKERASIDADTPGVVSSGLDCDNEVGVNQCDGGGK